MNKRILLKHLIVLSLTLAIFFAVFRFVSFENALKRKEISSLQENVLIDLMANETQFDLLKTAPCDSIIEGSSLSNKMDEIGRKLTFAENHDESKSEELLSLKKYYSLLEVKDYLLSQELIKKCPQSNVHSIIYFYRENCKPCVRQGYVLSELKKRYPWVRIYSFDYDLDFPVVKSFGDIYHVTEGIFPVLIFDDGSIHRGFTSIEEIEEAIPELEKEKLKHDFLRYLQENEGRDTILEEISCLRREGENEYLCSVNLKENKKEKYIYDGENFSQVTEGKEEENRNDN